MSKSLQKHNIQIVNLQETHLVGSHILGLKQAWVGSHYHDMHSSYSRGVSILVAALGHLNRSRGAVYSVACCDRECTPGVSGLISAASG